MRKKILIIFLITFLLLPIMHVRATNTNKSSINNNYVIVIEDDANLLTEKEEQQLRKQMEVLTEFGNVMFKTTNTVNRNTSLSFIQNYYYSMFGNRSGVAFYIDMNKRQVCACATGGLDRIITSSKCDTIMDNVYTYAKRGNYYECAAKTFSQMNNLLNGEKIAESMKYISNGIIAVMVSLFVSYGLSMLISGNRKATNKELIDECKTFLEHSDIGVAKTGTHSEYSPVSDSSSSGGGSSGGGGRRRLFWKWRKSWILTDNNTIYVIITNVKYLTFIQIRVTINLC